MWQLVCNGVAKTLEEWGVCKLSRTRISAAKDIVTFTQPVEQFEQDLLFAEGQTVVVKRSDPASDNEEQFVNWFSGRVLHPQRVQTAQGEAILYTLAGPWWYLEQLTFQQYWKVRTNLEDPPATVLVFKSHLLLCLDVNGNKLTTGQQIKEAVDFCIACGAPFTLDETWLPTLELYIDEINDLSCAEVIHRMLRASPDAQVFFDYSTDVPVLRFRNRDTLTDRTIELPGPEACSITARTDLATPAVVIKYETVNEINGAAWSSLAVDAWPEGEIGLKFGSIVQTVSLEGGSMTYASASVVTSAIDIQSADWWKSKLDILNRDTITNLVIEEASRPGALPRELVDGIAAPEWMAGSIVDEIITAKISYDVLKEAPEEGAEPEVHEARKKEEVSVPVRSTNLLTQTYTMLVDQVYAEPQPVGLARALYEAANAIQYEGQIVLRSDEVEEVSLGEALNFTGGRPEWAAIRAHIQQIKEDVDNGQVVITIGPRKHLAKDDIMALLRVNRRRVRWTARTLRTAASAPGQKMVLPSKPPKTGGAVKGGGTVDRHVIGSNIILDKEDTKGKETKVRKLRVCIENEDGTTTRKYQRFLCSDPYDDDDDTEEEGQA